MANIVDLTYLEKVCEGDKEFMQEMIEAFIETTPESISDLNSASLSRDWEQVARVAHKMKPSVAFMGIEPLREMVLEVESLAKEGREGDHIKELLRQVGELSNQAIEELKLALNNL